MAKKTSKKKKQHRPIDDRIAEQERKLAELVERKRKAGLTTALEDGRVSEDDQPAFKKLKKELGALSRAASITSALGQEELSKELRALSKSLEGKMHELIGGASESKKDEGSEGEPAGEGDSEELEEDEEWEEEEED